MPVGPDAADDRRPAGRLHGQQLQLRRRRRVHVQPRAEPLLLLSRRQLARLRFRFFLNNRKTGIYCFYHLETGGCPSGSPMKYYDGVTNLNCNPSADKCPRPYTCQKVLIDFINYVIITQLIMIINYQSTLKNEYLCCGGIRNRRRRQANETTIFSN